MNKKRKSEALIIAYKKIDAQIEARKKRASKLIITNAELAFQTEEKGKRADELIIAKIELTFQSKEKEKRASELALAEKELAFQNKEKEKRAAELVIANKELVLQNEEQSKRAEELAIATKELAFQNEEKEKRSAELILANKELAFQSKEKQNRASELAVANLELNFQKEEKIKRAAELVIAEQFAYVASHNLQEPLRTISDYLAILEKEYAAVLDDNARNYIHVVNNATKRMAVLIKSLLGFSHLDVRAIKSVDFTEITNGVIGDLEALIKTSNAVIKVGEMPVLNAYEIEITQVFQNLITNAIKFQYKGIQPKIQISSEKLDDKWRFSVSDNGIGIESSHFKNVFNIFQRLQSKTEYEGNGIGLANCKKIIDLHQGEIWIESVPAKGSTFHFTIPI